MHSSASSSGSMSALVFQLKVRSEEITVCLHTTHTPESQAATGHLFTPHSYCVDVQIERRLKSSFIQMDSVAIHSKLSTLFFLCSGALPISWLESLLFSNPLIFIFIPNHSLLFRFTILKIFILPSCCRVCGLWGEVKASQPSLIIPSITTYDGWHTINLAPHGAAHLAIACCHWKTSHNIHPSVPWWWQEEHHLSNEKRGWSFLKSVLLWAPWNILLKIDYTLVSFIQVFTIAFMHFLK